jgi:hypothetical protein
MAAIAPSQREEISSATLPSGLVAVVGNHEKAIEIRTEPAADMSAVLPTGDRPHFIQELHAYFLSLGDAFVEQVLRLNPEV